MGRFKEFFFKHLGRSQDAKALYSYLQENDYNNFDNIRLCDNFDGAEETHPQIATAILRKKLHILKEFVALGGTIAAMNYLLARYTSRSNGPIFNDD